MTKNLFLIVVSNLLFGNFHVVNAQTASQTGSLIYSIPLISLPSNEGPSVSFGLSYNDDIKVNQQSSEIGLGWGINLSPGIHRQVNKIPDDCYAKPFSNDENGVIRNEYGYSWNYYNYIETDTFRDFRFSNIIEKQEEENNDKPKFFLPSLDQYSVSTPLISGEIAPTYFSFEKYSFENTYNGAKPEIEIKPHFVMQSDFHGKYASNHYPWGATSYNFRVPGDLGENSSDEDYTGAGVFNSDDGQKLLTTSKIEYFYNYEIIENNNATNTINNFFEAFDGKFQRYDKSENLRSIGAFKIYDQNGYCYHFSLPVKSKGFYNSYHPLDNDYQRIRINFDDTIFINEPRNYGDFKDECFLEYIESKSGPLLALKQGSDYVNTWLLTYITGPTYIDKNDNKIIDEDDKGYWIKYDWQLWNENHITPSTINYNDIIYNEYRKQNDDQNGGYSGNYIQESYNLSEQYYLNFVQSSSHTLIFVRDIKLDEKGILNEADFSSTKPFIYKINENYTPYYVLSENTDPAEIIYAPKGILVDGGGLFNDYNRGCLNEITIAPQGAEEIEFTFDEFYIASSINDPQNTSIPQNQAVLFGGNYFGDHWPFSNTGMADKYYDNQNLDSYFNIESECINSWIQIYDIPSQTFVDNNNIIGAGSTTRFCGEINTTSINATPILTLPPNSITLPINLNETYAAAKIILKTDQFSPLKPGFKLNWTSQNPQFNHSFISSKCGYIVDPGGETGYYPSNSNSNRDGYVITIAPQNVDFIEFLFEEFRLYNLGSNLDRLRIFAGPDTNSQLVYDFRTPYNTTNDPLIKPQLNKVYKVDSKIVTIKFQQLYGVGGSEKGFILKYWGGSNNKKYNPSLMLSKILLFKNSDFAQLNSPVPFPKNISQISFKGTTNNIQFFDDVTKQNISIQNKLFNNTWLNLYSESIMPKVISGIEFTQDYNLAKNFDKNIYVSNKEYGFGLPDDKDYSISENLNPKSSGKLTLNGIKKLGYQGEYFEPETQFFYSNNPDYNPSKENKLGGYKENNNPLDPFSLPNTYSETDITAWNLTHIKKPLGEVVKLNYEMDYYNGTFDQFTGKNHGVSIILGIKSATSASDLNNNPGERWEIELFDDQQYWGNLLSNLPTGSEIKVFIPFETTNPITFVSTGNALFNYSTSLFVSNLKCFEEEYIDINNQISLSSYSDSQLKYLNSGYIIIVFPFDKTVRGFSKRLNSIENYNGRKDKYSEIYRYKGGIITFSNILFSYPKFSEANGEKFYEALRYEPSNFFDYPFQLCYKKFINFNSGENGDSLSKTIHSFYTGTGILGGRPYLTISSDLDYEENIGAPTYLDSNRIIEVTRFGINRFGSNTGLEVYDKFGNLISKKEITEKSSSENGFKKSTVDLNYLYRHVDSYGAGGMPVAQQRYRTVSINRFIPSTLYKTTETAGNLTTVTEIIETDELNGLPKNTKTSTSDGRESKKEIKFAHEEYSTIGSIIDDSKEFFNTNIVCSEIDYLNSNLAVSGNFSSATGIVLTDESKVLYYDETAEDFIKSTKEVPLFAKESYLWAGPIDDFGLFDDSYFVGLNHNGTSQSKNWLQSVEPQIFSENFKPLQSIDREKKYHSSLYDINNEYKICECGTNLESFVCSGFENVKEFGLNNIETYFDGFLLLRNGSSHILNPIGFEPHSGIGVLKIDDARSFELFNSKHLGFINDNEELGLQSGRNYTISLWVYEPQNSTSKIEISVANQGAATYTIHNLSTANNVKAVSGDWKLIEETIKVPENLDQSLNYHLRVIAQSVSGDFYIDDLRVFPTISPIRLMVFNKANGFVDAIINGEGLGKFYSRNPDGSIKVEYQEFPSLGKIKIAEYEFHFQRKIQ